MSYRQSPRLEQDWGAEHARPQAPQFIGSLRGVSQVPSPSQSSRPLLMHCGVAPDGLSVPASAASPPPSAAGGGLGSVPHAMSITHTNQAARVMGDTVRGTGAGCHGGAA